MRLDVEPTSGRGFLTGDAVNVAARLEAAAPPGGVVVGELTHELTRHSLAFAELEPLHVKGKEEPIHAWLATAVREARSRTGLRTTGKLDTPFLGRERELLALETGFDEVVSSRRTALDLLVGEPGIGKSRLVLEFARLLDERPELITWRQGRCSAYGDASGFAALSEVLKAHAGMLDSDDAETVEEKLEEVLPKGEHRAWLRQRLRPLLGLESTEAAQEESFAAWTRFLEHVAAAGPTVVVFEDLHWASDGMLAFVDHLAASQLKAPLFVLATTRPELVDRQPDLLIAHGRVDRLVLSALSRRDAGRLVSALLDERLAVAVRAEIIERVGGNPLYAEEYVRLLLDRDLLLKTRGAFRLKAGVDLPLPDTVQAVLQARLDTLPPEQKALLCDAAVFGETFWIGGVAALSERSRTQVECAMAALAERQFTRPSGVSGLEGESEHLFWHALAREVAYAQLPKRARARKHVVAAEWLEARTGERVEDVAETLAHHYLTALELAAIVARRRVQHDLADPAIRAFALAADRALDLDVSAAEGHLSHALALLPDGDGRRGDLLAKMGHAHFLLGRYPQASTVLEEAADALKEVGSTRTAARALADLSRVLGRLGDTRDSDVVREAATLLEGDGPSPELAEVYIRQSQCHYDGVTSLLPPTVLAGRSPPRTTRAYKSRHGPTRSDTWPRWHSTMRKWRTQQIALQLARAQGCAAHVADMLSDVANQSLLWKGADAYLQDAIDACAYAADRHLTGSHLSSRVLAADGLRLTGRWDEALRDIPELAASLVLVGERYDLPTLRLVEVSIHVARGDTEDAVRISRWLADTWAEGHPGLAGRRVLPHSACGGGDCHG